MTAVAVLAVAAGIGVFLFLNQTSSSNSDQVTTARGLACPYLQQAADAYKIGDHLAYKQAISQAAHVAEETLQTSGQTFGEPERIALELDLAPDESSTHVERLLELALRSCHDLGAP